MMREGLKIGLYNFDDDLIDSVLQKKAPRVKVYSPEKNFVVMGRGSKEDLEIETDNCIADGMAVVKRRGGGCSVVLDPGNLIVSIAAPVEGIGNNGKYFSLISDLLINSLEEAGIKNVYHDGISDLVIDDKKIAGACIYRTKGLLYYSVSILVRPELESIEKYLKHPPREPKYRRKRKHRDFVMSLSQRGFNDLYGLSTKLREIITPELISQKLNLHQ